MRLHTLRMAVAIAGLATQMPAQDVTQQSAPVVKHVQIDTIRERSVGSCKPDAPNRTIARCGLHFKGKTLTRGDEQEVIDTKQSWIDAIPLSRHVASDSAIKYALIYEKYSKRTSIARFVGVMGIASGLLLPHVVHSCATTDLRCPDERKRMSRGMQIVGGVSLLVSIPLAIKKDNAGRAAIEWDNATMRPR